MKLEHYPLEKLKKEILKIVVKYFDTNEYRVFFFGSRVKGDNFSRSDIDIGIEGPKEISAIFKLEIEEELEKLPLLYKIDLVDFRGVSDKFKNMALRHIEIIS
ncbi:MAG: nucleotidyltransferase domain-containing protein [Candidatus Nealsonbacteria bacterium]|nr:nucleotidyltransferase domain-containing protein [Candidatus Nealsonbacteria bacterium]